MKPFRCDCGHLNVITVAPHFCECKRKGERRWAVTTFDGRGKVKGQYLAPNEKAARKEARRLRRALAHHG